MMIPSKQHANICAFKVIASAVSIVLLMGCGPILSILDPRTGLAGSGGGGGGGASASLSKDYRAKDASLGLDIDVYEGSFITNHYMFWQRWAAEGGNGPLRRDLALKYATSYKDRWGNAFWLNGPPIIYDCGEGGDSPRSLVKHEIYSRPISNPNIVSSKVAHESWFGDWRRNKAISLFCLVPYSEYWNLFVFPAVSPKAQWLENMNSRWFGLTRLDLPTRQEKSAMVLPILIDSAMISQDKSYWRDSHDKFCFSNVPFSPRIDRFKRSRIMPENWTPGKDVFLFKDSRFIAKEEPVLDKDDRFLDIKSIAPGPGGTIWYTAVFDFDGCFGTVYTGRAGNRYILDEVDQKISPKMRYSVKPKVLVAKRKILADIIGKPRHQIGCVEPDGTVKRFRLDGELREGFPAGICQGSDGAMWFTLRETNAIGRITRDGVVSTYRLPTPEADPRGICQGSDGAVWFTEFEASRIGRCAMDGTVTEFPTPTPDCWPCSLVLGPDGNIWFTEVWGAKIGRITPQGRIDEVPVPWASYPYGITIAQAGDAMCAGPGRVVWFSEKNSYERANDYDPRRGELPIGSYLEADGSYGRHISRAFSLNSESEKGYGRVDVDLADRMIDEGAFKEATGRPFP